MAVRGGHRPHRRGRGERGRDARRRDRIGSAGRHHRFLSSPSLKVPPDVMRFQTGMFGRYTFAALAYNVDTLLVAQFAGAADVGLYRAARLISDTGHYPFQSLKDGVQLQYSRQWYFGQGAALRRTSLRFSLVSFRIGACALRIAGHLPSTHRLAPAWRGVFRRRLPHPDHDSRRIRDQQHFRPYGAAGRCRACLAVIGGRNGPGLAFSSPSSHGWFRHTAPRARPGPTLPITASLP